MNLLERTLRGWRPKWSPTVFRGVLATVFLGAVFLPVLAVPLPFLEFFNDMGAQSKAKTQMTYGRTFGLTTPVERMPATGAIPRGYESYPFEDLITDPPPTLNAAGEPLSPEDLAKVELARAEEVGARYPNPVPRTLETMKRGQKLYDTYCMACHGALGHGDGPITGPERFPAPPSQHTERVRSFKDGTIFHIITAGIGKMPGYRGQLTAEERWMTIHYLRALQRSNAPTAEDLQP